jgi:hypothetical protein
MLCKEKRAHPISGAKQHQRQRAMRLSDECVTLRPVPIRADRWIDSRAAAIGAASRWSAAPARSRLEGRSGRTLAGNAARPSGGGWADPVIISASMLALDT